MLANRSGRVHDALGRRGPAARASIDPSEDEASIRITGHKPDGFAGQLL